MINLMLCIFDNICIVLPYEINDFIIIMMCADIYDSVACIIHKLMMVSAVGKRKYAYICRLTTSLTLYLSDIDWIVMQSLLKNRVLYIR